MAAKTFEQVLDEVRGKPILVANRGIPARRICRAIRERFNAVPVMTATDIDKAAPAASSAQELLLLGQDPRAYLDLDLIIAKAKQRGIIAIHPGWGFASEDERFPQKCEEAGIAFIGSQAESMNLLGNKVQVRKIAKRLGIPVVPGSEGAVDIPAARKVVDEITLPIMLKAEGGGGGRGIFLVREKSELEDAFFKASAMAPSATRASMWKSISNPCATSRFRSSRTSTATSSPSTSATAPCSATTRSSWKSPPRRGPASRPNCANA